MKLPRQDCRGMSSSNGHGSISCNTATNVCNTVACHYETLEKSPVAVGRAAVQGFLDHQHGIQHPAACCQIPLYLCCQEHAMDYVQPSCILNTKQISNQASWAIAYLGSYIPS